jgi:hypothetical protein
MTMDLARAMMTRAKAVELAEAVTRTTHRDTLQTLFLENVFADSETVATGS